MRVRCDPATVALPRVDPRQICQALLAWLIGLNISDVITTRAVLSIGGTEANPVMRGIVDSTAHASFVKCLCLTIVVGLVLRTRFPGRVALTLVAVNFWYALVVGWNLGLLARA
ncbi:MAG: DUF5658 family protein [Acidimicrobiales bacterium]